MNHKLEDNINFCSLKNVLIVVQYFSVHKMLVNTEKQTECGLILVKIVQF